jgi:tRNA threonylcarbamoyl adenosine modification protein YeaZ
VRAVLDESGLKAAELDLIAVTVGPGSFTGIRSAVALAQGIGTGAGIPVAAVTVGEALAAALPNLHGRQVWSVIDSRRNRVFLERDGAVAAWAIDALPDPGGPVAITGDAAAAVASRLAARGANVMLTDSRFPSGGPIARIGTLRLAGALRPLAVQPLYVDPPEAKPPRGGLRAPPVP